MNYLSLSISNVAGNISETGFHSEECINVFIFTMEFPNVTLSYLTNCNGHVLYIHFSTLKLVFMHRLNRVILVTVKLLLHFSLNEGAVKSMKSVSFLLIRTIKQQLKSVLQISSLHTTIFLCLFKASVSQRWTRD
ncbi:hypothetical protein FGIG_01995 [Fasciola gigantica]|uniref:Uncharacterized protein n=1 Tax=Fasciola gigantica TaxID=46835 RepID=A0A504YET9_FASGI|nr:hypothetical protein FGIG_01995 [Fasciola gigantica]